MGVKVLTIVGTRPEAIKLFPLIKALEHDPRFTSCVCVTGQHRELLDEVLRMAEIEPAYDLDLMTRGQSADTIMQGVLRGLGPILDEERPDWVVVQGDTTSAMAASLAAHHRRIAVCHVEAGLRTGNRDNPWPEEANRRIIACVACLHCAPTTTAASALAAEGIEPGAIAVTGNTGADALRWVSERIESDPDLACKAKRLVERHAARHLVTVTLHRRESHGAALAGMAGAVAKLAQQPDIAVVVPVHPNPEVGALMRRELGQSDVELIPPLGYADFIWLLKHSTVVMTDSGGVQEEAPALGTPVLVLRETTERPEGVEAGSALLLGTDPHVISARTRALLDDPVALGAMSQPLWLFGDGYASIRICELLACPPG